MISDWAPSAPEELLLSRGEAIVEWKRGVWRVVPLSEIPKENE